MATGGRPLGRVRKMEVSSLSRDGSAVEGAGRIGRAAPTPAPPEDGGEGAGRMAVVGGPAGGRDFN